MCDADSREASSYATRSCPAPIPALRIRTGPVGTGASLPQTWCVNRRSIALAVAAAGAVHAGPAVTWLPAVRLFFPRIAGRGAGDHVALTFDDGPDPRSTPRFLGELRRLGCSATFF